MANIQAKGLHMLKGALKCAVAKKGPCWDLTKIINDNAKVVGDLISLKRNKKGYDGNDFKKKNWGGEVALTERL